MWNAQRTAVQCRPVGLSDSNQINQITQNGMPSNVVLSAYLIQTKLTK